MKLRRSLQKLADAGWTLKDVIELLQVFETEDTKLADAMLSNDERLTVEICNTLKELGITRELNGHQFLIEAIIMIFHKEFFIYEDMDILYEKIAVKTKTDNPRKVQSAMRTAITARWETIRQSKLGEEIFGGMIYNKEKKPTTKCFIKQVAEYIEKKI